MGQLPPLDIKSNTNHAPHVVILGAGASLAAFPDGDALGRRLPLMRNLVEVVGLESLLRANGILNGYENFESLYDSLATNQQNPELVKQLESSVHRHFESMRLPNSATLYDLLLLSLREKDVIATFNWDPFLAQAFRRNASIKRLPRILFLHGNVAIGACTKHRHKGFIDQRCSECGMPFQPTRLLFPVRQKNYTDDPFIHGEWVELQWHLERAYLVTIFGYSAPATDIEARNLLLDKWLANKTRELAEIEIIDVRPRDELEANWGDFFVRQHYAIFNDINHSLSFRHVRRSCDAFAMATLQQDPWEENPFPKSIDLPSLQKWVAPLLKEEDDKHLSGKPCPHLK